MVFPNTLQNHSRKLPLSRNRIQKHIAYEDIDRSFRLREVFLCQLIALKRVLEKAVIKTKGINTIAKL